MSEATLRFSALAIAAVLTLATAAPARAQQPQSDEPQVTVTVTVTATRLPAGVTDVPAAVRVVEGESLQRRPTLTLDGALGWDPAVSLFRRTSSIAAHPTSQGLNLRGLAPSGVSRALVLVDGVPINDPFGGWVYWDRVPLLTIERVEVAPGGGSAPWGNQALGGVVQLITREARAGGVRLQALGGTDATSRFGISAATPVGPASLAISAEIFHTGGYVEVAPAERGAVDRPVASTHQTLRVRADLPGRLSLFAEALRERRENGTPLQRNLTNLGGLSATARGEPGGALVGWSVNAFARSQRFESTFSSVADDRDSERLVLEQRVPATDVGAGGFVWRPLGGRASLSVGGDWRRVAGHSKEHVVAIDLLRAPGGRQHLGGAWAAVEWQAARRWSVTAALRADGWRQTPVDTPGEPRSAAIASPRVGFVLHAPRRIVLRGAGYTAFRAPTLNELYRQFRVGNVITRENPDLDAERLHGGELGVSWSGALGDGARLTLESTWYWNRLEEAIINATESTTPTLVFRRRRNLGAATVRGLELSGRLSLGSRWQIAADGAWLDAEAVGEPGTDTADLDGKRLAQVPEYRARATLTWLADRASVSASVGGDGRQFEDDLNTLVLAGAATVDLAVEVPVRTGATATLRVENVLDHDVPVKRTPTLAFGPPRSIYAGVSLEWPAGGGGR